MKPGTYHSTEYVTPQEAAAIAKTWGKPKYRRGAAAGSSCIIKLEDQTMRDSLFLKEAWGIRSHRMVVEVALAFLRQQTEQGLKRIDLPPQSES